LSWPSTRIFNTGESDMSIKALIRKWTGRGGAVNRATCTREVCRLSALAMAAKVSVWDLD
jgi:hypothetical protein